MKKRLVLLFSLATLGLVSCGGGNDVASSGASAVSAAAPVTTSTTTPTTTEPKVNGQIDERTGVAPVVAQATLCTAPACPSPPNPWTVYSNGGCMKTSLYGGSGPSLTKDQDNACREALWNTPNGKDCIALGGLLLASSFVPNYRLGGYDCSLVNTREQCSNNSATTWVNDSCVCIAEECK